MGIIKKKKAECSLEVPSAGQLERELNRVQYKREYSRALRSTAFTLVVVAAIAIIAAVLLFPVLRISGSSMADTLQDGDIVVTMNHSGFTTGDVVAFYYNNHILIKRVIATAGDWVDIDGDGNVSVNGEVLEEPYLKERALGNCNITLPYQVPDDRIFVMGDQRATSVDSRNSQVGCIGSSLVVGRVLLRVWPLEEFGLIG